MGKAKGGKERKSLRGFPTRFVNITTLVGLTVAKGGTKGNQNHFEVSFRGTESRKEKAKAKATVKAKG